MKIKTEEDVERLNEKIKADTGVDIAKYRNEEVIGNFTSLLLFPIYLIKAVRIPILLVIGLFILSFFIIDLQGVVEYLFYVPFGAILWLLLGILSGLIYLAYRLRKDLVGIIDYALTILKMSVNDAIATNKNITKANASRLLPQLFKGIIHIIVIPVVSGTITSKVPLVGGLLGRFVRKVFRTVANLVKFDELSKEDLAHFSNETERKKLILSYNSSIDKVSKTSQNIVSAALRITKFPLVVAGLTVFLILALLIYLVN